MRKTALFSTLWWRIFYVEEGLNSYILPANIISTNTCPPKCPAIWFDLPFSCFLGCPTKCCCCKGIVGWPLLLTFVKDGPVYPVLSCNMWYHWFYLWSSTKQTQAGIASTNSLYKSLIKRLSAVLRMWASSRLTLTHKPNQTSLSPRLVTVIMLPS